VQGREDEAGKLEGEQKIETISGETLEVRLT
jgi:hypothetical protein